MLAAPRESGPFPSRPPHGPSRACPESGSPRDSCATTFEGSHQCGVLRMTPSSDSQAFGARTEPGRGILAIEDLLRYGLSGAVTVLTMHRLGLGVLFSAAAPAITQDSKTLILALGGVLGLLCGAFTYSVHRALLHPYASRLLIWIAWKTERFATQERVWSWNPFSLTELEQQLIEKRWQRRRESPEVHEYMRRWGSQTHFLYTVPLAYWLGCIAAAVGGRPLRFNTINFVVSIVLFAVAMGDEYRATEIELRQAFGAPTPATADGSLSG